MSIKSEEIKKTGPQSSDWKEKLIAPAKDTRYKTTVNSLNILGCYKY